MEKTLTMKEFVTNFLDKEGVTWKQQANKIVISDEFQEDIFDEELGFGLPYVLTEFNYPHSLNKTLREFNDVLDNEFGHIFECEWSGTFSIILED